MHCGYQPPHRPPLPVTVRVCWRCDDVTYRSSSDAQCCHLVQRCCLHFPECRAAEDDCVQQEEEGGERETGSVMATADCSEPMMTLPVGRREFFLSLLSSFTVYYAMKATSCNRQHESILTGSRNDLTAAESGLFLTEWMQPCIVTV